jgi:Zn-dependent peptidase ImmA (M78 family)
MKEYEIINANAERVATAIYDGIGDTMPSILSLVRWTEENFGIKIEIRFWDTLRDGHSGFVYPDPKSGIYKIGINSKEIDYRQRFTQCHELAHIIRNVGLKYGLSCGETFSAKGTERFCERFAAAFLMPAEIFIHEWKTIREPELFKKVRLASFFKVSGEAVRYRAKELGLT